MARCSHCHQDLISAARFCHCCGTPVKPRSAGKKKETALSFPSGFDQNLHGTIQKMAGHFQSVLEAADDVFFLLDRNQRYQGIWGRWMTKHGLTPDLFLGKTSWEIFGEETEPFFYDLNKRVLGGETVTYCKWFPVPWGETYYHTTLSPFPDDKGRIVGIVGVCRDITEIKQTETALEEANRLKDLFIDIMQHDLLNVVNIVKGSITIGVEGETNPEKKDLFRLAIRNTDRIIEIIKNAGILARMEGVEKSSFKSRNLAGILKTVIRDLEFSATKRGITIHLQSEGRCPAVVNPLIDIAFANLLRNAIQYAPEKSAVDVNIENNHPDWKISVSDQGPGIADENKEEIFTRFKRLEKGAVKGTGLGLTIARKIVENHQGKMWVDNNPTGGSTFFVQIPKGPD